MSKQKPKGYRPINRSALTVHARDCEDCVVVPLSLVQSLERGCADLRDEVARLRARTWTDAEELARLRDALVKVRAHTSYLPGARRELLQGLLGSVERIVDAELHEAGDGGPTP